MIWVFKELTFPCSFLSKGFTDSSLYPTDTKLPVKFPALNPGCVIRTRGLVSLVSVWFAFFKPFVYFCEYLIILARRGKNRSGY